MNNHQWMPPAVIQAEVEPADGPAGPRHAGPRHASPVTGIPPGRTVRGILILAVLLGSLSAEAATTGSQAGGDKASPHHAAHKASNISPEGSAYLLTSSGHVIRNPWVY